MVRFNLFIIISLVLCTASCGQKAFDKHLKKLYSGTVPLVNQEELQNPDGVLFLDTRSQEEFDVSHIEGAQFIDYDTFQPDQVIDLPRDTTIVVYCSVGYRSERIGEKLQEMGFTNVKNLYGGIFDWKNKDNEIVNPKGQPTDSVHTYNFVWSKWLQKGTKVY
ncbi:MAG: rhodanese-like domain-containing protein [Bacteroidota bacterium]